MIWIFVRDCYGKCPRKLNFNCWKDWNLGKTQEIVRISDAFKDCRNYITPLPCMKGVRRYYRKILQKTTIWGWDGCTRGFLVCGRHINFSDFRFFVFLVSSPDFTEDVTRVSSCSWARKLISRIIVPMAASIRGWLSHYWVKDFPKIRQFFKNNQCDTCEIRTHAGIAHGLSRAAP